MTLYKDKIIVTDKRTFISWEEKQNPQHSEVVRTRRPCETAGSDRQRQQKWVQLTGLFYRSSFHLFLLCLKKKHIPGWLHAGVTDRQDRDPAPLFLPANYLLMTACLLCKMPSLFPQRPHQQTTNTLNFKERQSEKSSHTSLKLTHTRTSALCLCIFISRLITLPFKLPTACDGDPRKRLLHIVETRE